MGLIQWIETLFAPRRDVSRLATIDEDDVDTTFERVTSGGPLVPGHRREAVRDPRLLPKRRKRTLIGNKRIRVLDKQEADRLFAGTMRTRNREIRDLATDEAQLERYGLPVWRDELELARALELSVGELRFFSIHREMERASHYVRFAVEKKSGGRRVIMAPKRRLKAVQRRLVEQLVRRLPVSEHAHGFREGRSVRSAAEPHVGKRFVVCMDLEDFFGTVHFGRVRGLLIALGYAYPVATTLAVLMTEAERQPTEIDGVVYHVPVGARYCVQGAPTSPGVCNAVVLRLDRRLAGLARSLGFEYTRYADDLAFSGDDVGAVKKLITLCRRIVRAEGFRVNEAKTRVMRSGGRQVVNGVTVNRDLGLSRKERRRLRAALHQLASGAEPGERERLVGRLAYVRMLNPAQADVLARGLM